MTSYLWQCAEDSLPNDALYMVRVTNLEGFRNLVSELISRSGKTEAEMLRHTLGTDFRSQIAAQFPFIEEALNFLFAKVNDK